MRKRIDNDKILEKTELDKNNNAVSHTETTGLVPSMPEDNYSAESYRDIIEYRAKPIVKKPPQHTR